MAFKPSKHHAFWVTLFILFLGVVIVRSLSVAPQLDRIDALPLHGATFDGEPLQLTPQEGDYLGNAEAIKRLYTVGGDSYVVVVIDGTHNRAAVRTPESCFLGAGYSILEEYYIPIPGGKATALIMKQGEDTRHIIYWYTTGYSHHSSPMKQSLQSALRRISPGSGANEPFLVIVETANPKTNWNSLLSAFPDLLWI